MNSNMSKGVTPVIATVLLLGITVLLGGMLVTVAQGYFQDLGSGVDTTDMSINSVYQTSSMSSLNMSLTVSSESPAINTSNYRIYIDGVPQTGGSGNCFDKATNSKVINPGDSYTCTLSESMPNALQSMEIEIQQKGSDRSWTTTCEPQNSGATSCTN